MVLILASKKIPESLTICSLSDCTDYLCLMIKKDGHAVIISSYIKKLQIQLFTFVTKNSEKGFVKFWFISSYEKTYICCETNINLLGEVSWALY